MGISVSVDSWVQQTLEDLSREPYPRSSPIYRKLLSSASVTAEIFVLEPTTFIELMNGPTANIITIMLTCIESLVSNDSLLKCNGAALLTRMFPYLCDTKKPIDFSNFVLGNYQVFDQEVSPGCFIVETIVKWLTSIATDDGEDIINNIDTHIALIDLLLLTVFLFQVYYKNLTLYHQLIIASTQSKPNVIYTLFNYVHVGGRQPSMICLLSMYLFHPTEGFISSAEAFLKASGQLSSQLCRFKNDETDIFCAICSLALPYDEAAPELTSNNPDLLRIALTKYMSNASMLPDIFKLVQAYHKTNSPLARAVISKISGAPPEVIAECHPLTDFIFDNPLASDKFHAWFNENLPYLFLNYKSFIFDGTSIYNPKPSFSIFDELVNPLL